jgi:hypothetical protein
VIIAVKNIHYRIMSGLAIRDGNKDMMIYNNLKLNSLYQSCLLSTKDLKFMALDRKNKTLNLVQKWQLANRGFS